MNITFWALFKENKKLQIIFLIFFSLLIFLGRQQDGGLLNYDDCYYGQKAKEMLQTDNIWVVHYHGQPVYDNPPFHFWVTAFFYKIFGVNYYTSVLASGLFASGTVLLAYFIALELFNSFVLAFFAGVILLLPGYFLDYARRAMTDQTLTFFVTLALFSLLKADKSGKLQQDQKQKNGYYILFGLATGIAILTKSILGIFPLIIAFSYFLFIGKRRNFLNPLFLTGIIIALGLPFIWMFINYQDSGEKFIKYHFGWLIFTRAMENEANRSYWYLFGYIKDLWKNFWPWIPFATLGFFNHVVLFFKTKNKGSLFLVLCPVVVIGIMSLSKTQILRYILCVFPILAIITAWVIQQWLQRKKAVEIGIMAAVISVIITALFINVTPIIIKQSTSLSSANNMDVRNLSPFIRMNTPDCREIINYKLDPCNPRNSVLFYTDRYLNDPVTDPDSLVKIIKSNPSATVLTAGDYFEQLKKLYPSLFYVIKQSGDLIYFTSSKNISRVRYNE